MKAKVGAENAASDCDRIPRAAQAQCADGIVKQK
jgi:hypothetical protein